MAYVIMHEILCYDCKKTFRYDAREAYSLLGPGDYVVECENVVDGDHCITNIDNGREMYI